MKSIAIIGASNKRDRFANKAVRAFRDAAYTVYPVHPQEKTVEGLPVYKTVLDIPGPVDIASLYIPPAAGMRVIEQIAKKGIKQVYVNPGADSKELLAKADQLGVETLNVCSIVAIGKKIEDY
jgi:hypothetical protein